MSTLASLHEIGAEKTKSSFKKGRIVLHRASGKFGVVSRRTRRYTSIIVNNYEEFMGLEIGVERGNECQHFKGWLDMSKDERLRYRLQKKQTA